MTLGTVGFVPRRLTEAREASGLSQTHLAQLIEVSRQAVSAYEKGIITPSPEVAASIANTLRVPTTFFFRETKLGSSKPASSPTFFRSFKRRLKAARDAAAFRMDLVAEIVNELEASIDFPSPRIPNWGVELTPGFIPPERIEIIASELRVQWGLGNGPITNMVWLLENNGALVVHDDHATREIQAFSTWRGDRPIVFLSKEERSPTASRFDAAHELGHLLLHRSVNKYEVVNDELHDLLEAEAHYFASAFLMPTERFPSSIIRPTLEELIRVKPIWGVSIQAQIMRLTNIGHISPQVKSRLFRDLSARGWRKKEPLDEEGIFEKAELLSSALTLALKESLVDEDILNSRLGIKPETVWKIFGVSPLTAQIPPPEVKSKVIPFPQQ